MKTSKLFVQLCKRTQIGRKPGNAKVVRRLFRLIEQGSTLATIFWLKTRAGWKEGQTLEIEQKAEVTYDYSKLTEQERVTLRATLENAVREQTITH